MPLIEPSSYRPPLPFRNTHINTIYTAMFRRVTDPRYERERIDTPDDDFLDLDWSRVGSDSLVVVLHGLEGSADRPYVRGMIRAFNRAGWDGLGFNFRGCSGELNRQCRSYHMLATEDVDFAIRHAIERGAYRRVALIGFSLGGNVALNYLSDGRLRPAPEIGAAVCYSVPCHIPSANECINHWQNTAYRHRFMVSLMQKMQAMAEQHPHLREGLHATTRPRRFDEFDGAFTAPIHGFKDADHYWSTASSLQHLPGLSIPTLLVQAADDTFLSAACYPTAIARTHRDLFLEVPRYGGHCGFYGGGEVLWSERRALEFLEGVLELI